ncbi:MAG: MiaB/RimO family radical SAM methylthiotransferase [Endomicrobium sp.]|jgi:threonylcarbamoyladenosine tRNA methylthiotransferase MtaB|nr:MiaB/RimO family radical SAM methylthiotransferase [Endomicrobium sp.]
MKKYYYIHTFGCKVNQYESQLISEKFQHDNFKRAKTLKEADIIVVNSCTVTEKADKECKYFLKKIINLKNKPKILLTGCIVKNKNINMKNLLQHIEIVTDKKKLFKEQKKQVVSGLDGHSRAFLKIQDGCDSFCTYCIVPYVRNTLWSKPECEILSEIKNLVQNKYCEIVLTGINIGKYSSSISNLIEKIMKIPLKFRIRISSIELNEVNYKLIKLMQENPEKICRHLHIPLQSGSNEILKKMNRQYLVKDFEEKTNMIIKSLPDIALTTDIIVGFPGETKKDYEETCNFVNKIPFARIHVFKYSNRYITKASALKNIISYDEVKNRSKYLLEINCKKKINFINKNLGQKRSAVKIGKDKALTDNYITTKLDYNNEQDNIFEVEITKSSII